jgi:hypothetical protein
MLGVLRVFAVYVMGRGGVLLFMGSAVAGGVGGGGSAAAARRASWDVRNRGPGRANSHSGAASAPRRSCGLGLTSPISPKKNVNQRKQRVTTRINTN